MHISLPFTILTQCCTHFLGCHTQLGSISLLRHKPTKISWVQACLLCFLVKNITMRIHKEFEPIVWPAHTDTALSLLANRSLQGGWSICLNLCVAKHTQENANFLRSYFWLALLVLIFEAVWFLGILLVSPQKSSNYPRRDYLNYWNRYRLFLIWSNIYSFNYINWLSLHLWIENLVHTSTYYWRKSYLVA